MSALTNAQLPAGFTTIEQLAAYVAITLWTIYPTNEILLTNTQTEKAADAAILTAADGKSYLAGRFFVPLNADYTTVTTAVWASAQEIAVVSIPSRLKA